MLRMRKGICQEILDVIVKIGWQKPTDVQIQVIPQALRGRDIIGLAETGSGKTAAFAIPILQDLIQKPRHNFSLILTPTRELAIQLKSHFLMLGDEYGLKVTTLIGGQHLADQIKELKSSKFHIIIGTPGRVVYHLENSRELRLNRIRYLVLDEADQMLDATFESQLSTILSKLPDHRTFMFSATMSKEVTQKKRTIIFTTTWRESLRLAFLIKHLPHICDSVAPLNGNMQQDKRQETIYSFRNGDVSVLVATDLASRGLDIPEVDLVINYDVPHRPTWSESSKSYIHRVGRTARAGRAGRAITLVTPYSVVRLKAIEAALGQRIPQLQWPGVNCVDQKLRNQIQTADVQARALIRDRDKKRLAKKRQRDQNAISRPVETDDSD